jgi:hypothetical protein
VQCEKDNAHGSCSATLHCCRWCPATQRRWGRDNAAAAAAAAGEGRGDPADEQVVKNMSGDSVERGVH